MSPFFGKNLDNSFNSSKELILNDTSLIGLFNKSFREAIFWTLILLNLFSSLVIDFTRVRINELPSFKISRLCSIILTVIKSISEDENRFRRINVQKIVSLKDLLSKPINEVIFNLKSKKELEEISKFLDKKGETIIKINLNDKNNNYLFRLENKRNIDRKMINLLRNKEISAIIS